MSLPDSGSSGSNLRGPCGRLSSAVCQYLLHCANTMLKFITPKMMELLPHLCAMESYDIDRDLQAHCVRVSPPPARRRVETFGLWDRS